MNLASFLLGLLLFALLIRATYVWFIQDAGADWYQRHGQYAGPGMPKPWYVRRYDRWEARVRARRARQ